MTEPTWIEEQEVLLLHESFFPSTAVRRVYAAKRACNPRWLARNSFMRMGMRRESSK